MDTVTPIPDLLVAATSSNASIAGVACRELLNRHTECGDHVPALIDRLRSSNAAISDYAFRTLERIGETSVSPLVAAFHGSDGRARLLVMGLIAQIAGFDVYFPLLKNEIGNGGSDGRIWAANCLGRNFTRNTVWPSDAMIVLDESIEILISLRGDTEHWSQARMTLKHLGQIPDDAE